MRHETSTHEFTFEPPLPAIAGPRSQEVISHFGIDPRDVPRAPLRRPRCPIEPPSPGELMLITGASGSGKSFLLRALRRRVPHTIDLRLVALPEKPVIELFAADVSLERTLKRLARVGLAEVWTWLRPPSQLSEGQRWRLRLAIAIEQVERSTTPVTLICDEFAAVLDRITACIVANVLRRTIDAHADRLTAVVATSHNDLAGPLKPDVTIECDFGRASVLRKDGEK